MSRRTSLIVLAFVCIAMLWPSPTRAEGESNQLRGMWVDASNPGFHTPAEVDELVDNAAAAGMNTLFVQMRRHGDAMYRLSSEPRSAIAGLAPAEAFDPLADLLAKAHARGINVHAWLVMSVACRDKDPLRGNPQHLCTSHGPGTPDPQRWTTATFSGAQVGDLDFGHPEAVNYMTSLVERLLASYPALDGIHYDYIRYSGQDYGYNQVSLARFRAAHGLPSNYRPAPADPEWSQWRRDRITELVRRLYIRIKAINPRVQVSAATITWGGTGSYSPQDWPNSAAYSRVFQDWRAWLEEGLLDFAVPMHYFGESDAKTRAWYDGWLNWDRTHTGRRAIVPGTGAWLNDPQQGMAQIQRALAPDAAGRTLAGVALYCYNQPISNSNPQWRREYMQLLRANLFAAPSPAPTWPWIAQPTTGHLQGMAMIDNQLVPDAHVTLFRDGAWVREFTAAVDGWYGAVELEPGTYTVQLRNPRDGHVRQIDGVQVGVGRVTSAP